MAFFAMTFPTSRVPRFFRGIAVVAIWSAILCAALALVCATLHYLHHISGAWHMMMLLLQAAAVTLGGTTTTALLVAYITKLSSRTP